MFVAGAYIIRIPAISNLISRTASSILSTCSMYVKL